MNGAKPAPDRLAVRPDEAANMIGVSRIKIYKLIRQGKLKSRKDGNTRLILVADLNEYLHSIPSEVPV